MPAGEAEHVVHPLRGLAVVEVVGEVLAHLLLEPLDVVVERVVGDELRDLGEHRQVVGVEVDLLEVRVEVAVERHDLAVRRLPGDVDDVARVGELGARRVGDDPVELAPARDRGRPRPSGRRRRRRAALFGLDVVELPAERTRRSGCCRASPRGTGRCRRARSSSTLSRIRSAINWQASSRVGALRLRRWK